MDSQCVGLQIKRSKHQTLTSRKYLSVNTNSWPCDLSRCLQYYLDCSNRKCAVYILDNSKNLHRIRKSSSCELYWIIFLEFLQVAVSTCADRQLVDKHRRLDLMTSMWRRTWSCSREMQIRAAEACSEERGGFTDILCDELQMLASWFRNLRHQWSDFIMFHTCCKQCKRF